MYSVLLGYTIDGWLPDCRIEQGSFDGDEFIAFIRESALPYTTPYPGPRSVLMMDNCNTHNRNILREMCKPYGVLVEFLPAYCPFANPIEPSFGLLKHWIRRHWKEMPVYSASSDWRSAFERFMRLAYNSWGEGVDHSKLFRKAGVTV